MAASSVRFTRARYASLRFLCAILHSLPSALVRGGLLLPCTDTVSAGTAFTPTSACWPGGRVAALVLALAPRSDLCLLAEADAMDCCFAAIDDEGMSPTLCTSLVSFCLRAAGLLISIAALLLAERMPALAALVAFWDLKAESNNPSCAVSQITNPVSKRRSEFR